MKQKMFLTAAALVLLFLNLSPALCQTGVLEELDPNILWVADSSIGRIDGFAVHPNGNIFAYFGSKIYEIDGSNGKLIKELPVTIDAMEFSSIDISSDGSKLAVSWNQIVIIDLQTFSTLNFKRASLVKFVPNSSKIIYSGIGSQPSTNGSDSSIVILDLETQQRSYIKTEEMITKIAFSPDGRFIASGGSGKDVFGKSYVSLKLWDANTLKLINELEKIDNVSFNFERIEFSNNSKIVGFLPLNGQVSFFNTESSTLFRKYDQNVYPFKRFGRFCFIKDSLITFTSITGPGTFLLNNYEEKLYKVGDYLAQSGLNYSNNLDAIILGTTSKLYAYSLSKIITSISEEKNQTSINAVYSKGILTIKCPYSIGNQVKIEIFDINGKMVRQLKSQANNSEIRVPLILPRGTYILNITEGHNQYSSKFLVTE
jgi:WD40 repeat protein